MKPLYSEIRKIFLSHYQAVIAALLKLFYEHRDGIFEIASEVNASCWDAKAEIKLHLTGLWFQISNGFAFYEIHAQVHNSKGLKYNYSFGN